MCSITKKCIRQTFHKTIAKYWEWEDGNQHIYTMYYIVNKLKLHGINQQRINSKVFSKYQT